MFTLAPSRTRPTFRKSSVRTAALQFVLDFQAAGDSICQEAQHGSPEGYSSAFGLTAARRFAARARSASIAAEAAPQEGLLPAPRLFRNPFLHSFPGVENWPLDKPPGCKPKLISACGPPLYMGVSKWIQPTHAVWVRHSPWPFRQCKGLGERGGRQLPRRKLIPRLPGTGLKTPERTRAMSRSARMTAHQSSLIRSKGDSRLWNARSSIPASLRLHPPSAVLPQSLS